MKYLYEAAKSFDIELSDEQLDKFSKYYEMLVETNKVMNLTAITEKDEVIIKHFLDSISLIKYFDITGKSVIDVGTGAGFPGIPLKIVCPDIRLTLLDSLNKRINFLKNVSDELGLEDITFVHGRAEDIARDKAHREQYDVAVSRAVANLSTLTEYCLPFVEVKGCFMSYKSVNMEEELSAAKHALKMLGGEIKDRYDFELYDSELPRSIIKIEKVKTTPKTYPRKAGTPSKNPL